MLVSVIIPCYNVELYIKKCLSSVYAQSYKEIEVILVDDGSSDQTVDCIRDFLKSNSKNATLIEQKNQGACTARNRGLQDAKGEYIQFLDADDWIKPEKIADQIKLVKEFEFPDLIVGSSVTENERGVTITKRLYDNSSENDKWLNLVSTNLGNTCSNLFKAELFENGIKWNESLKSSQEYNLMFEILKKEAKICYDSKLNTVIVRREVGSISTMNLERSWKQYIDLRKRIIGWMKANNIEISRSIYQSIFDAVRMSSPYNLESAIQNYKELLPASFSPKSSLTTSKLYLVFYKLFGFVLAEKIWAMKNYLTHKGNS